MFCSLALDEIYRYNTIMTLMFSFGMRGYAKQSPFYNYH